MGISSRLSYTSVAMAHLVLSRKLRPKTFEEVAGQDHIVNALKNSIRSERLGHAYLFAGTRGVGKTTIARIFSRAIRCQNRGEDLNPCGECAACLNSDVDIIEIDGASNNSVENIRDLISTVQYLPTNGPYRIFIIDEVHMLSTSAFNALLKTLEEPPSHVKFLFATTDPHKLIDTVLSRCIRFDLRPLSGEKLIKILGDVVQKESIQIDSEKVIELISGCAKGSLRDALSLTEQALSFGDGKSISFQDLEDALGIANLNDVEELIDAIIMADDKRMQQKYKSIVSKGIFLNQLCTSILDQVYDIVNAGTREDFGTSEALWVYETLSKDFKWALDSLNPFQTIGLILKKVTLRRTFFSGSQVIVSNNQAAAPVEKIQSVNKTQTVEAEEVAEPNESIEPKVDQTELKKKIISESLEAIETSEQQQKEAPPVEEVPVAEQLPEVELKDDRDFSFGGFLEHVGEFSPAMRTNLQHGNFLTPLSIDGGILKMEIGFKPTSQVFADYFLEKDINDRLSNISKRYFDVETVQLKITVVDEGSKEADFSSVNEQIMEQEEIEKNNRQETLQNSDNVKIAEKLFSSKVDKIILNENN
jgi:DNA polymerase-3 subunit gamma/tau